MMMMMMMMIDFRDRYIALLRVEVGHATIN